MCAVAEGRHSGFEGFRDEPCAVTWNCLCREDGNSHELMWPLPLSRARGTWARWPGSYLLCAWYCAEHFP